MRTEINDERNHRDADEYQPDRGRYRFSIRFQSFSVFDAHGTRRRRRSVSRQLGEEILDGAIGIEPNLLRVGPNECAREDAAWKPREIAALERLERHD